jgi:hypothetical protein
VATKLGKGGGGVGNSGTAHTQLGRPVRCPSHCLDSVHDAPMITVLGHPRQFSITFHPGTR